MYTESKITQGHNDSQSTQTTNIKNVQYIDYNRMWFAFEECLMDLKSA